MGLYSIVDKQENRKLLNDISQHSNYPYSDIANQLQVPGPQLKYFGNVSMKFFKFPEPLCEKTKQKQTLFFHTKYVKRGYARVLRV